MKNNILKNILSIATAALMAITSTTAVAASQMIASADTAVTSSPSSATEESGEPAETTSSSFIDNPHVEIDGERYYLLQCTPDPVTVEVGETAEVKIVWGTYTYDPSISYPAYTGELPEIRFGTMPGPNAEIITTDSNDTFYVKGLYAGTSVIYLENADGFTGNLTVKVTDANGTTTHATGTATGTTTQTTVAAAPEDTTTAPSAETTAILPATSSTTNIMLISLKFSPASAHIGVGETITVTMYRYITGEEWTGDFPEITVTDPDIVSVTEGDTPSTFKITGLALGGTSIQFVTPGQGSASFYVGVTDAMETTETTVTTTTIISEDPLPAETTATTINTGIMCNVSEIKLNGGERKTVGLYFKDGNSYTGALPSLEIDNPAVAAVNTADIPYNFYVTGISDGTAVITITDPIYGYTTTLNVTVTGTYVNGSNSSELDIVIHALPDKRVYSVGEELDLTGGMYSIKKYAGTEREMMIKDQIVMNESSLPNTDAFDSTTPGTYPIVLSYSFYDGSWDIYVFYVVVREGTADTGDIDGSGEIDIADATTVLEYYACTAAGMIFDTPINAETADIDGSDETSISDATYILTYYAKKAAGLECSWNEIIGG